MTKVGSMTLGIPITDLMGYSNDSLWSSSHDGAFDFFFQNAEPLGEVV